MMMNRAAERAMLAIARVGAIAMTLGQGCATDHDEQGNVDQLVGTATAPATQVPERDAPAAGEDNALPVPLQDLPMGPFHKPPRELRCGEREYAVAGEIFSEPIVHDLDKLELELASSAELRAATGLARVSSCEDAERLHQGVLAQEPAARSAEPPPEPVQTKILGGTLQRKRGSVGYWVLDANRVRRGWCSGSLYSTSRMITAAHCFSPVLGTASGRARVEVVYYAPGGTTPTITSDDVSWAVVDVIMHPDYSSTTDHHDDLAIVKLVPTSLGAGQFTVSTWQGLPGGSTNNFVSFSRDNAFTGVGFKVNGYGVFDSTNMVDQRARSTRDIQTLDADFVASDNKYFLNDAPSWGRMCEGDSGSQAIYNHKSTSYVLLGVWSNSDRSDTQLCTPTGARQRWTAIAPKASWITGDLCRPVNDTGVRTYECW